MTEPTIGAVVTDNDGQPWRRELSGWVLQIAPGLGIGVGIPWRALVQSYGPVTPVDAEAGPKEA